MRNLRKILFAIFFFYLATPVVLAAEQPYRLGIAPVLDYKGTMATYRPLADYLSRVLGKKVELVPSRNFIGYWSQIRKEGTYDFLLDGAHLAAYRMQKMGHRLVAQVDGVLSFTLISRPDDLILDTDELVNRRVAVLATPNLGGLQVYNLFANPARQPIMVEAKNVVDALESVRDGRADAAYVPTPILSRYPEATVIESSAQMPNMTMTASPRVSAEEVAKLRQALVSAEQSEEGRRLLEQINISRFVVADPQDYNGLHEVLAGMWGY